MNRLLVSIYRLSNWLFRMNVPILPKFISFFLRYTHAIWLPASANIGKGIVFGYGGLGVVIHSRTVIGDNCKIDQGVTIGGKSGHYDVPVIGDCVFIGAGAKVLGPITIGDGAVIGANSVVVKDVLPKSLVAGIPAKTLKNGIDFNDYI